MTAEHRKERRQSVSSCLWGQSNARKLEARLKMRPKTQRSSSTAERRLEHKDSAVAGWKRLCPARELRPQQWLAGRGSALQGTRGTVLVGCLFRDAETEVSKSFPN